MVASQSGVACTHTAGSRATTARTTRSRNVRKLESWRAREEAGIVGPREQKRQTWHLAFPIASTKLTLRGPTPQPRRPTSRGSMNNAIRRHAPHRRRHRQTTSHWPRCFQTTRSVIQTQQPETTVDLNKRAKVAPEKNAIVRFRAPCHVAKYVKPRQSHGHESANALGPSATSKAKPPGAIRSNG